MTDEPIGRRVARWRLRRRMTQQMLADRLGKSKSWVDKVERGVRALDRYSVLQEIAEVLRIHPTVLLGEERPQPEARPPAGVDRIRAALARYDVSRTPPAGEVQRHVEHAWLTYGYAHYAHLVRLLPDLLDAARSLRAELPEMPVQVYRITSSVLVKLGEADLGWLAADRAMTAAGDEPLLAGAAALSVGQALRALGRDRLALAVTLAAAPRDVPVGALHGTLLLQAALAAASSGDARRADGLIDRAAEIASRPRCDDDRHRTSFGPVAVELARVVAAVELGDAGAAVCRHERVNRHDGWRALPAEYRGAYLLDAARAYLQAGDLRGAGRTLVEADGVAPAEVRWRPVARTLVAEIARRHPAPAGVARLAASVGLMC
ncbi:helix-turn-helix domain-containing protein [Micromonospora sp. NPDC005299]|uniref:helix-turn-helix domain-containing protein n=1 Tax=Micromonospora sp. NPDC005299 TaxID=3364231 RepID=UPI00367A580B